MTERPILFSALMVQALLEGRKTQTRRLVKPVLFPSADKIAFARHPFAPSALKGTPAEGMKLGPESDVWQMEDWCGNVIGVLGACPFGVPGDRLWVREAWGLSQLFDDESAESVRRLAQHPKAHVRYLAGPGRKPTGKTRPSIHMPRSASRLTLEIVAVKVERLLDITESDAAAEGVETEWTTEAGEHMSCSAREAFADLWQDINGAGSWHRNPWVWVVEFRRLP